MRETESAAYAARTRANVRDSDGTLVLTRDAPRGGTRLTVELAMAAGRPLLVIDLAAETGAAPVSDAATDNDTAAAARDWIRRNRILVLNVAGPRESSAPGIHAEAAALLSRLLAPGEAAGATRAPA